MTQVIQTPEQKMYLARLIGYNYSIQYRLGKVNAAVNALSRVLKALIGDLFVLSLPNFTFLK